MKFLVRLLTSLSSCQRSREIMLVTLFNFQSSTLIEYLFITIVNLFMYFNTLATPEASQVRCRPLRDREGDGGVFQFAVSPWYQSGRASPFMLKCFSPMVLSFSLLLPLLYLLLAWRLILFLIACSCGLVSIGRRVDSLN